MRRKSKSIWIITNENEAILFRISRIAKLAKKKKLDLISIQDLQDLCCSYLWNVACLRSKQMLLGSCSVFFGRFSCLTHLNVWNSSIFLNNSQGKKIATNKKRISHHNQTHKINSFFMWLKWSILEVIDEDRPTRGTRDQKWTD